MVNLTYNDLVIFYNKYNYLYSYYSLTYKINIIFLYLIFIDFTRIRFFGNSARWFQLHANVNLYISYEILPEVINIIKNPSVGYQICETNKISLLIISLQVYHILTFKKLNRIDYFHHILFVWLGVLPDMFLINYNQKNLAYIVASSVPGFFEYLSLTLYKNNLL